MDYLQDFKKELKNFRVKRSFKESIEPEEILVDAEKQPEFFEQKLETPLKTRVFMIFLGIIGIGLAVLIFRTGYFQLFKNKDYLKMAGGNSLRAYPVSAPRGLIYDRNLKTMVNNMPSYDIWLSPQDLPKDMTERETMIEQISSLLELSPKDINDELLKFDFEKTQRILLVYSIQPEKIMALESRINDFPSLAIEEGVVRQYPFGGVLSHVLGYTGKMTKEDMVSFPNYLMTDRLGKDGLEAEYESVLKGQAGERQVEVDAKGKQIKELGIKEAIPGQNIVTNIDLDLQKKIYEVTSRALTSLNLKKAAVVALNPKNGQILGLVSLPGFDNNLFEQNTPAGDLEKIWQDASQPLFDRAISGQYPSGSIIKPLMGSAALQEQVVTPSTIVNDPGNITIVNQYNPSIIYNFPDWKAHGKVNMVSAIAQSCDVYFYTVGGGWGNIEGLGIQRIKKYFEMFGLGKITGIDLPGEKEGLVPDEEWKQKTKNEQWFIGDTYHVSIGQGDLLVTPLQMAAAIASIANGGKLYSPYLVDKIIDSDKNVIKEFQAQLVRENFIRPEYLDVIRKGMRESVVSGTSHLLADLPVEAAGKTGTAQIAGQSRPNAWFVTFAPYEDPKIVLVVMVEDAGEGSSVSAPIAKQVLKWYFER